jgi:iron complex outermembrane receptor protein
VLHRDDTWNALLPSLGVSRHLDAPADLVFTVSRGFKPGGYSAYTDRADLAGYQPQRTWGLEAALSTAAKDSGWAFTSRAYAYDVRGYQIERSFAVPAATKDEYLVVNADRAQVLGLEVEASWRPARDLVVGAVAGLTHATLEDFTDPFIGRNLGDKAYYSSITPGVGHGTPGAPFTWGAEVSCRW